MIRGTDELKRKGNSATTQLQSTLFIMSFTNSSDPLVNELSCPICFQLFSDLVVLPCGQNYCRTCIWITADKSDQTPPCCPECREKFQDVDFLQKNLKLCNFVEGFRAANPQLEGHPQTEPEVFCDQCIDELSVAMKSCWKFEVSLCSRHFQKHQEKEKFRSYSLVEPLSELGMKSCIIHHRPLEYFCSKDTNLFCATCFMEGHHQSHDILTFSAAEEDMRRALQSRSEVVIVFGALNRHFFQLKKKLDVLVPV